MDYSLDNFYFGETAEYHEQIKGRPEVREPFGDWIEKRRTPGWIYPWVTPGWRTRFFDHPTLDEIETFFREHPELSIVINITQDTPLPAVVQYLAKHSNITDLTDELSRSGITSYAIARGGYSDVYRATRSDGTILAIKCLRQHDAKHVKHTARELNTWSKLKHENILELYGLALFQGCLAMVSPWMKFGSVGSVVKKWPDMDRYKLCYQLALVVDYLHQENVVHGDIKGDNVLVAEDGTLKLTDFGLAILHDEVLRFSQTDPGGGTCRWMAPELYKDDAQRCRETDVYAMGMTMLEIITGDIPFREIRSGHSVVLAVVHEKRTPEVPELQQEPVLPRAAIMYQVLKWCWGYTPSERPTASQVVSRVWYRVDSWNWKGGEGNECVL